jgi:hypothetical protein
MTLRTLVLVTLLLAVGCRRDVATTVLEHAPTVPPSSQLATDVARFAREGMKVNAVFNRLPVEGEIAVILAAPSTNWNVLRKEHRKAGEIQGNCFAFPRSRSVVCDSTIFTNRPNVLLGRAPTDEQRTAFARWTIGHELGHLATATAGFDIEPRHHPKRTDLPQQRREYAADCWMVQTFARLAPLPEQISFETFAMDVINEHFRRVEPNRPMGVGFIFDYTSLDPYQFPVSGAHPDEILRSIRLLHIATEQRNNVVLRQMMLPLVRKLVPDPLWTGQGPCGLS